MLNDQKNKAISKNNRSCKNRGFSLMEAVIAMVIIAIVFTTAMTAVTAESKARLRSFQNKYCVSEVSNILECYKLEGGKSFINNVKNYLGIELKKGGQASDAGGEYTEYYTYYDVDFKNKTSNIGSTYRLTAKLYADGISINIIKINTDSLLFETDKYQSRFDLQNATDS